MALNDNSDTTYEKGQEKPIIRRSAGGIIVYENSLVLTLQFFKDLEYKPESRSGYGREVLDNLVSNQMAIWLYPKGGIELIKKENGLEELEHPYHTALREINEETGLTEEQLGKGYFIGRYQRTAMTSKGFNPNLIHDTVYYHFTLKEDPGELTPLDPNNPGAILISFGEVPFNLSHSKDVEFFNQIKGRLLKKFKK